MEVPRRLLCVRARFEFGSPYGAPGHSVEFSVIVLGLHVFGALALCCFMHFDTLAHLYIYVNIYMCTYVDSMYTNALHIHIDR